jgi:hypothetical protein
MGNLAAADFADRLRPSEPQFDLAMSKWYAELLPRTVLMALPSTWSAGSTARLSARLSTGLSKWARLTISARYRGAIPCSILTALSSALPNC